MAAYDENELKRIVSVSNFISGSAADAGLSSFQLQKEFWQSAFLGFFDEKDVVHDYGGIMFFATEVESRFCFYQKKDIYIEDDDQYTHSIFFESCDFHWVSVCFSHQLLCSESPSDLYCLFRTLMYVIFCSPLERRMRFINHQNKVFLSIALKSTKNFHKIFLLK